MCRSRAKQHGLHGPSESRAGVPTRFNWVNSMAEYKATWAKPAGDCNMCPGEFQKQQSTELRDKIGIMHSVKLHTTITMHAAGLMELVIRYYLWLKLVMHSLPYYSRFLITCHQRCIMPD